METQYVLARETVDRARLLPLSGVVPDKIVNIEGDLMAHFSEDDTKVTLPMGDRLWLTQHPSSEQTWPSACNATSDWR